MASFRRSIHPQVELQIAPMIDVCFLLLFFYLLTSKPVKPEADLRMTLPGTVAQEETLDLPDEQRLEIKATGQIVLNDMEVDAPADIALPQLRAILLRYKESCDANKSEALVTLDPEDDAIHQRIADVMNACARAGITGVTFASATDEENDF